MPAGDGVVVILDTGGSKRIDWGWADAKTGRKQRKCS